MKLTALSVLLVLSAVIPAHARASGDPLAGLPPRGGMKELFLLWGEGSSPSTMRANQRIFKYLDSSSLAVGQRVFGAAQETDNDPNRGVGGNQQLVVATGSFNSDRYEDAVAAWAGQDRRVDLLIPVIDPASLSWNSAVRFSSGDSILAGGGAESRRIYLTTGNFDADAQEEFVLAYHGADSAIHLELYDVDSTLTPRLSAAIHDVRLAHVNDAFSRYSLAAGDFDGDGKDEIALAAYDPNAGGAGVWGVTLTVYAVSGALNDTLVPKVEAPIFVSPGGSVTGIDIALVSGRFTSDTLPALAFGVSTGTGAPGSDTYLEALRVSKDLAAITVNQAGRAAGDFNNDNEMSALSLAAGDLNIDGRDEVVLALHGAFHIYDVSDSLTVAAKGQGPTPFSGTDDDRLTYAYLAVGDIDHDFLPDIIVVNDTYGSDPSPQTFDISLFGVDSTLQHVTLKGSMSGGQTAPDNGTGSWRHYAVAAGDFGGGMVRVGTPYHYVRSSVVEPIVILNAPPVHFDVFDTSKYDISSCYNGGACDFDATYEKSTLSSIEVKIGLHDDWGITLGSGLSGTLGEGATVNYSAFSTRKWGAGFSKDSTASHTFSIDVAVKAEEDDQIYATVSDYDIWEYPIYLGLTDTIGGAIVVRSPSNIRRTWFPSKSWNASSYVPDHEVGQILSYQAYDTLDQNPNMDEQIRASYQSDSYTLGSNTSYDWNLTRGDFSSIAGDTTHSHADEGSINFVFIVDATDNSVSTSTHTTSVTSNLNLHTHLGKINLSYGETRYTVTPYAYWARNGALVVDYAVRPELAAPGFPPTWWQQKYGANSNPTFILPWRNDPEKGFGLSEEAKRYQTKDITFDPVDPQPGDTVKITARVRNFSLAPTPGPVFVRFYVGDPDSGGTVIAGTHGENSVSTPSLIPSRGRSDVSMRWVVPGGLTQYPRIYAVVDPNNTIPEIHENDNKGFNVLGEQPIATGIAAEAVAIPTRFALEQNYPNPFNPATTIRYQLPVRSKVSLIVYDLLGQTVARLVDQIEESGAKAVSWNAASLASGVYFCRLEASGTANPDKSFSLVRKMMLMK